MADSKLTALTATTTPSADDELYIVTDTAGTPTSQKIKYSDLVTGGGTSTPYEQSFTATAAQTNFTLTNTPVAAWVWKNGLAQDASTWSISGDDIVLSSGANAGDSIEIYYLSSASVSSLIQSFIIFVTPLDTDAETGIYSAFWDAPYDFTITEVIAACQVAPTGAAAQIDVMEGGVSILSTVITIDDGEVNSLTSATPPVISDSAIAKGARITFELDQVGSTTAGQGYQVQIIGHPS